MSREIAETGSEGRGKGKVELVKIKNIEEIIREKIREGE